MIVAAQFSTATRSRMLAEILPRPFNFRGEWPTQITLVRANATEAS
jgi:hypothetical protein